PVLTYAKDGDKAKLTRAMNSWSANARQIAAFLSRANPKAWPLAATNSMMATHLALTTQEAVAHLEHRWAADIAAYDKVRDEILMMPDPSAPGIAPRPPPGSAEETIPAGEPRPTPTARARRRTRSHLRAAALPGVGAETPRGERGAEPAACLVQRL